jgi:xanthine dehydrogenase YagR molybdenum-binding subunit
MSTKIGIGAAVNRVDGRLKVTGEATYAGEFFPPGELLYGVMVCSGIARGRIAGIDSQIAETIPGVVSVITHRNRPHVSWFDRSHQDDVAPPGSPFRPLYDDRILFSDQPVALVVAESFEAARYAASLVEVDYEAEPHNTDFQVARGEAFMPSKVKEGFVKPTSRGNAAAALQRAPVRVEADYHLAPEHHNPMEPHASTVIWHDDGKITVYDKIQGVQNSHRYVCNVFGFAPDDVKVLSPFVGGAFGSGLRPQHQLFLAVMAAKMLQRSVRVTMTRQQMFTHGYRPECAQQVSLGAGPDGRLTAMVNAATTTTSRYENYMENVVTWGGLLYRCDNAELTYTIAPVDTHTTADMRAPGAATGMTLFEIAMDELAYATQVDPLELRLRNYSDREEMQDKPYTSKALRDCYIQGAARFGWSKRIMAPRAMREGNELIGWGMATGVWEALQQETSARAWLKPDGTLEVATATADIGTGTYTVMTQVAAEAFGLPLSRVVAKLGDSTLPMSPVEGGSWTAASTGAAVDRACSKLKQRLLALARGLDNSPLANAGDDQVSFADGRITLKADPSRSLDLATVIAGCGQDGVQVEETASPDPASNKAKARNTHSAIFAEVRVDEELGTVRVTRIVNAVAAGRIINPKTAASQVMGGVVFGIGMALEEESLLDHRLGRFMNHSLAEYHLPVNADIHAIDVLFVSEPDAEVSPLGVKGVGEIGVVGTAAAIANAIFHATGKRLRELPITVDKIIG